MQRNPLKLAAAQAPADDPYLQKFLHALDIVGSRSRFCQALWVGSQELDRYLSGRDPIPFEAYMVAVDIVARGRR